MPSRAGTVAATVVAAILALAAGWLYFALRHAQEAQKQLAAEQAALKQDVQAIDAWQQRLGALQESSEQ